MKTLMLDDKLYAALEVEQWLLDTELDEAELREIKAADREWREHDGVEAGEFFDSVTKKV